LDRQWLDRWDRSGARYPTDVAPDAQGDFARQICAHPQFTGQT
jgi:hypothetical protein